MSGKTVSRGNYLYLYRSLVNYGGAASREEKSKEGGDNAIPLPRIERKKKGRSMLAKAFAPPFLSSLSSISRFDFPGRVKPPMLRNSNGIV